MENEINDLKNELSENVVVTLSSFYTLWKAAEAADDENSNIVDYLKLSFTFVGFLQNLSKTDENVRALIKANNQRQNNSAIVHPLQKIFSNQECFGSRMDNLVNLKLLGLI